MSLGSVFLPIHDLSITGCGDGGMYTFAFRDSLASYSFKKQKV